jgi:hypothetical protein
MAASNASTRGSCLRLQTRKGSFVAALALCVFTASLAVPQQAFAQDAAAAADVLFNQARALTEKGDFAAACPKLEESQRLDPGMGTLYRLADCYEKLGRTASAWAGFREVASQAERAGQAAREADARQRAAALESALAHMTVEVPNPPAGIVVERDGVQVGAAQWGISIPVDPGAHTLAAKAPGKTDWKVTFDVPRQGTVVERVPALVDVPPEAKAAVPGTTPQTDDTRGRSTRRTAGLVIGGVGVAALGVGTVFGVLSMGHKSDVDKNCDAVNGCSTTGANASKSAVHTGNFSTGFFIAGGVLAAGGVALFLTAPTADAKKTGAAKTTVVQAVPLVSPSLAGLGLSGKW